MLMNIIVIIHTNDNVGNKIPPAGTYHTVCSPAGTYHPVYQIIADQFPRPVYWKKFHYGNQQIIKLLIDNNNTLSYIQVKVDVTTAIIII